MKLLGNLKSYLEVLSVGPWILGVFCVAFLVMGVLYQSSSLKLVGGISGMITLAKILEALTNAIRPRIARWRRRRLEQKAAEGFIPYMTARDKAIIGYLLYRNQKMFLADKTGELAVSLIARGIIRNALQHGQAFTPLQVPFCVPDHIWTVLERNRKSFPYTRPDRTEELYPWKETQ